MLFKVGFPSGERILCNVRREVLDFFASLPLFRASRWLRKISLKDSMSLSIRHCQNARKTSSWSCNRPALLVFTSFELALSRRIGISFKDSSRFFDVAFLCIFSSAVNE